MAKIFAPASRSGWTALGPLLLSVSCLSCGSGGGAANPTYTVMYDGNGSTGGSAPADTNHYQTGQTVTVLGNTGNLSLAGFSFTGWNTQPGGSGTTYTQGQTFTMGSANVALYAKWTANPTYTVAYDGNGSTGGTGISKRHPVRDVDCESHVHRNL